MTWVALLLADPSPCLRWLALRDLLHLPADHPEVQELAPLRLADPLVADLLALQEKDGSWAGGPFAYGRTGASPILSTALALARLGYLGFDRDLPAVRRAADYLFARQLPDGSWPLAGEAVQVDSEPGAAQEGYTMVPLQTAFPLRGLAACGYAAEAGAERAYDWLLAQRLEDGAWPTGVAGVGENGEGVLGYVAGYRRLAHSRWGCRSNTTGVLLCLSLHPERRRSAAARRALDLLLGRETRERRAVGFEVARLLGAQPAHGFFTFFARFDLALVLDLCARLEVSPEDPRLASLLAFIAQAQGPYGLWEYAERPQVARWVTFDLLRSLSRLDADGGWVGAEPRTPFRPYQPRQKRY
jgi:hypothetical protein